MRPSYALARFAFGVLVVGLGLVACGDDDAAAPPAPIPRKATSGFAMGTNAFSFENFARGHEDSRMTPALTQRMFGDDVCAAAAGGCALKPVARAWMNKVNASMDGGRCEGFAVLSSLLFSGVVDATPFGANSARALTLDGNLALQEELAYWFATQDVQGAAKTQKLKAVDALRFLGTILAPDAQEQYRIGIVRKTKTGVTGGHAVTPIRYSESKTPGVYEVVVYDNNYPDQERILTIDVNKGRWEYKGSSNPNQAEALYYGDDANRNVLYFSTIRTRVGKLTAPFGKVATDTETTFQGAIAATARDAAGNEGGIGADGEIVEAGSAHVEPSFVGPETWLSTPPIRVVLPNGDVTIAVTPGEGATLGSVSQVGPGFAVTVSNLTVTGAGDQLTVTKDGHATSYVNNSGTAVTLTSTVEAADGRGLEVELVVPGGGTKVGGTVDPETGNIVLTADGTNGKSLLVNVTKFAVDGSSVVGTLTVDGSEKSTVTIDTSTLDASHPLIGQQDNGAGPVAVGDTCTDGVKDGTETDVDCGGTCAAHCANDKGCFASTDCSSNVCNVTTNKCVATACEDGAKDGSESDVDCGGLCAAKCALGQACNDALDCVDGKTCDADTKKCIDPPPPPSDDRIVFVSSTTTTASMGGLAGADAKCQALATAAKLPGDYKAFLSTSAEDATVRIRHGIARYLLPDGTTVVANDAAAFFSGSHAAAINQTETKAAPASNEVWTGSQGLGTSDGTGQCLAWTSDTDDTTPYEGRADLTDERWMSAQFATAPACSQSKRLYCVQDGPPGAP